MKDGKNVYGSFGTGTSNGGMDYGTKCLNANPFTISILNLREKFMPEYVHTPFSSHAPRTHSNGSIATFPFDICRDVRRHSRQRQRQRPFVPLDHSHAHTSVRTHTFGCRGMGKKNDYPGHVIFGCSNKMKVSSNWHNAIDANLLFQLYGNKEWYTCEKLPEGFAPYQVAAHAFGVVTEDVKLAETFNNHKVQRKLNDIFPQSAHLTLQPGDMLINPPFSWHAIKVDQMSISLSLRGDKEDVISWLAYRYFDGNVDHPLMLCFSYFFHEYRYMRLSWSSWNLVANAGQMLLVSLAFMSPRVIMIAYINFARKCIETRKQIAEYFDRYE